MSKCSSPFKCCSTRSSSRLKSFNIDDILSHQSSSSREETIFMSSSSSSRSTSMLDPHRVSLQYHYHEIHPQQRLEQMTQNMSLRSGHESFSASCLYSEDHLRETSHPNLVIPSVSSLSCSPSVQSHQLHHRNSLTSVSHSQHPIEGTIFSWISPPNSLPRKRTVFTRRQRNDLESKFQAQKYISKSERIRFARELGLKDSQVKVWFINRRTKWRNEREKRLMIKSKQKAMNSQLSCTSASSTSTDTT